jgi:hypothetical protein
MKQSEEKSTPLTNPAQTDSTLKRNDVQKYDRRQQMEISLRKGMLEKEISTALKGITDIRALLHRIILSTDKKKRKVHTFRAVKDFLGELWFDPNFKPEHRGGSYKSMLIKQLDNFQINVLIDPLSGYYPLMMIEVHPRGDISLQTHKTFLLQLSKALPALRASRVEYTSDIFCRAVESLFWVLRHSLLLPYQRTDKLLADEDYIGKFVRTGKRTNFSVIWGNDKLYERGEDKNKKGEGWDYDDVDRVRLEHTADRRELKKHGIITLEDLIREPKFHEINEGIWKLKRFKNPKNSKKKLPQEWEDYSEMDDNLDDKGRGYTGSFFALYRALGRPRAYVESVPELTPLRESLIEAMKVFDNKWPTLPYNVPSKRKD